MALEGTVADDLPRQEDISPTTELGKGPAISVMDRSAHADRRLVRILTETATAHDIPWQFKQPGVGGTDVGSIHLARAGVPAVVVAVPCRYIHTPAALMDPADVRDTIQLMSKALAGRWGGRWGPSGVKNERTDRRVVQCVRPSGQEERISEAIVPHLDGLVDEVRSDRLGNLIAVKRPTANGANGKRIMLAAHMDEIGVMVTHVDAQGFCRFTTIGGVLTSSLIGNRVEFANGVEGAFGLEGSAIARERPTLQKLFLDVGATGKEDAQYRWRYGGLSQQLRRGGRPAVRCQPR